jgi:hypothetical protein
VPHGLVHPLQAEGRRVIVVDVYVDDLLVTVNRALLVREFHAGLESLELKDPERVQKFLGMSVSYDEEDGYELGQGPIVIEILAK